MAVLDEQTLLIPDYAGNNLFFGHKNVMDNPHIGREVRRDCGGAPHRHCQWPLSKQVAGCPAGTYIKGLAVSSE